MAKTKCSRHQQFKLYAAQQKKDRPLLFKFLKFLIISSNVSFCIYQLIPLLDHYLINNAQVQTTSESIEGPIISIAYYYKIYGLVGGVKREVPNPSKQNVDDKDHRISSCIMVLNTQPVE